MPFSPMNMVEVTYEAVIEAEGPPITPDALLGDTVEAVRVRNELRSRAQVKVLGYVIEDTDEALVISALFHPHYGEMEGILRIPTGCVLDTHLLLRATEPTGEKE